MCTLLIVEDEATFRDGIVSTIDWGAHGVAIVGAAANGQEAWALIAQSAPDILLTDIRMPVMDGLELLRRVKAAGLATQVILLSGFGEFEYAQQATKLGAFDYLLKPCRPEEILAVVTAAARSLASQAQSRRLAREQLLCQWLQGQPSLAEAAAYGVAVVDGPVQVGLLQRASGDVRGQLTAALAPVYGARLEIFPFGDDWVWIGNPPAQADVQGALERLPAGVCVGVGEVKPGLAELHASLGEARRALALQRERPQQADQRRLHRTVQAALKIVAAHYHTNLTLEAVAKEVFVSTAYLSTLFKQELGINFLDYLHQYRIERAKELMAREPLKVFAVAKLVGYQDERHFSATFKKWTGVSPSQYQKAVGQ